MKKLLFLSVAVTTFGLMSCNADRTCSCTSTSSGPGGTVTTTLPDTTLTNVSKREIKDFCNDKNDQYVLGLETITVSCTY